MDLSSDSDSDLHARLTQIEKEIADATSRLTNRTQERDGIKRELERRAELARIASLPPVDRSARILTNGRSESDQPNYREIEASGMQKSYVVLTPEERAKGFVRPVRRSYIHKVCGMMTTMAQSIAETYARDPHFYSGTFCCSCRTHLPLNEFVWADTDELLGS